MKKMKLLLCASIAVIALSGCSGFRGSTLDPSASPDAAFQSGGLVNAVKWCDKRDSELKTIKPIADTAGAVFDAGVSVVKIAATPLSHVINAAPEFARAFVGSNTAARNTQCEHYRKLDAEQKSATQPPGDTLPDGGSEVGDEDGES